MKIAFIISGINGGGAARVMTNLAAQFANDNNDVLLITNIKDEAKDYPIDNRIQRIVLLSHEEWNSNILVKNILLVKRINNILNEEHPDVAISFMREPNFRLLLTSSNVPKIISIRNDPQKEYKGLKGYITTLFFRKASAIVCQTNDVIDWLSSSHKRKATVIMNQVNPDFYNVKRLSDDYYFASGRLTAHKNEVMLIEAFHEFLKKHPNEKLLIYGDGKMRPTLQALIDKNGDASNIKLMGFSKDMPSVLAHAKCFILPSDVEGMPNGLLEAMAAGIPCISTDCPCGGPRMVIDNEKNGILIPVKDRMALIRALCKVEEDIEFRNNLGNRAKDTAVELFSPSVIYQRWKDLFIKVSRGM